ncbi:MAG: HTTM domain-containing protein [Ferruginibacter sp.]
MTSFQCTKLYKKLFEPVDNISLVIFRILFGFLLCWHCISYISKGIIYSNFIDVPFTFSFIGFEWLQPLPGNGMYYYVGSIIILAILVMAGAFYRVSAFLLAVLWSGMYLMQKANYNNHYYLVLLLCWLMVFVPAHTRLSVDAWRKKTIYTSVCARYCILLFIGQVAVVYFFAAVSKLTPDWFSGKVIGIQFTKLAVHPVYGVVYGNKLFQLLVTYGGFLFDLLIVPLLLWRRTRGFAFFVSCFFHLFNSFTFKIGVFPYLSIALNLFFLNLGSVNILMNNNRQANLLPPLPALKKQLIALTLGIYFLFQLILPVRSWFFPGNVFWNEEGYRMSWKMMMRSKSGTVYFKVVDTVSNRVWKVDPATQFKPVFVRWVAISPDITWQYAQRLKKDFAGKGFPGVKIYAISAVRLNRAAPLPLIDTTADLAHVNWEPFRHSWWITDH